MISHVKLNRLIASVLLVCLLCLAAQSRAARLNLQLPNGIPVNAEFLQGDKAKPAMLVLHGFLQTYEFMSTRNIVNGLASQGYSVLAPNLSLGVPNRQQSVQCTAIHSHTLGADLQEITFWVNWLKQAGHSEVILIGHSWGSQHALAYLVENPDPAVKALIAISLVRTHQSGQQNAEQIHQAQARLHAQDKALHPYALSFCKRYMATAQSYLSYAQWDDSKVLKTLAVLHQEQVPLFVIIGAADKRIDAQWLQALQGQVNSLAVVDGANHFFSDMYEFDLNDRLEAILQEVVM